jgi:hypothetical protein
MDYKQKYLKYKEKYLEIKKFDGLIGGAAATSSAENEQLEKDKRLLLDNFMTYFKSILLRDYLDKNGYKLVNSISHNNFWYKTIIQKTGWNQETVYLYGSQDNTNWIELDTFNYRD